MEAAIMIMPVIGAFIAGYFWGRHGGLSDSLEEATRKHNQQLIKNLRRKA